MLTRPSPSCPPCRRRRVRCSERPVVLAAVGVGVLVALVGLPGQAHAEVVLAIAASVDALLTNIRNWLMSILAALATVFLTIGGVRYVLADGDPGEVERAKSAFRSAARGYALAALAPLIVQILAGIVGA